MSGANPQRLHSRPKPVSVSVSYDLLFLLNKHRTPGKMRALNGESFVSMVSGCGSSHGSQSLRLTSSDINKSDGLA